MTYGYIRVSSDKQTIENQHFKINKFCKRENLKIDGWIEETISGTKFYDKRQLGTLLKRVKKDGLLNLYKIEANVQFRNTLFLAYKNPPNIWLFKKKALPLYCKFRGKWHKKISRNAWKLKEIYT